MNDTQMKKLQDLLAQTRKLSAKTTRQAIFVVLIYVLLVLFVFAYTTYIYVTLKDLATTENVTVALTERVQEYRPVLVEKICAELEPQAKRLAKEVVEASLNNVIPEIGNFAIDLLDDQVDVMMDSVEKQHFATIQAILDDSVAGILEDGMSEDPKVLAQAISKAANEQINAEINKIVNERFFSSVEKLQDKLLTLRNTPDDKLSRQDRSEKLFILYWYRLLAINQNKVDVSDDSGSTATALQSIVSVADKAILQIGADLQKAHDNAETDIK